MRKYYVFRRNSVLANSDYRDYFYPIPVGYFLRTNRAGDNWTATKELANAEIMTMTKVKEYQSYVGKARYCFDAVPVKISLVKP